MANRHAARLDFGQLIAAVENAPPVAAVDVLGARMTEALGARAVSFLIADFSGQALIRLGHAASDAAGRTQGRETAERVSLTGSPQGRAIASQTVEVEGGAGDARVFAPVTNRGEAIGVLEVSLLEIPDEQTVADIALAAHALAYVVIANRRFTDLFAWGSARFRCLWLAKSSIACCPAPTHARRASSRSQPGWNRPATWAATRSTSP